jgi:hypothetical protein
MKEIHAYQNDDGSFRVEITEIVCTTRFFGKHKVEDTTEKKAKIAKASIHITPFMENNDEALTFQIELAKEN